MTVIDEEMTLTTRALKKRRKIVIVVIVFIHFYSFRLQYQEKGSTDVAFNAKETPSEAPQKKKGKWSDETRQASIQPYDYSQFTEDVFNGKSVCNGRIRGGYQSMPKGIRWRPPLKSVQR